MKTLASLVLVPLVALPFLVVACGGAVATSPDDGNGGGSPSPSATGTHPGEANVGNPGTPSTPTEPGTVEPNQPAPSQYAPPCPDSIPADGTSCSGPGAQCEYGGIGPADRCSTIVSCYGDNNSTATTWHAQPNVGTCAATQAQNPSACPATFGAVSNGSACPAISTACVYPEGICACTTCFDAPNGTTQQNEWTCAPYPTAADRCPNGRPEIGTVCPTEGQTCSYGTPCAPIFDWWPMECKNGAWAVQPHGEDCSAPTCSTTN
jgi:hypothetical protein